ncbi:MAG: 50S ribosomal protein L3 [Lentisphaerae bacterium GWF2_44_16]|nr:MAG: 50S ribosomal protein L3 [Lentisphaerae bacterium GWF2_44_16]
MKKGLIGKKIGMTQVYNEKGTLVPVTVIEAGPCVVLDLKTKEKNGYSSIQLGFGEKKVKNVSKAIVGTCKKAGRENRPPCKIAEVRLDADSDLQIGAELKTDIFAANEFVDIIGITKGRGFQGVVKRYNFAGGRASHGGGWHRRTGSIGQKEMPGNIVKGKRMPGQMGNERRTIQNLLVVKVSPEENLLFVKGAVPGPNGGIVHVKSAKKK